MSKTSSKVKDRYNLKAYDEMKIRVPKGQKTAIEAHAQSKGESVNGLVNSLLRTDMGLSEDEWRVTHELPEKKKSTATDYSLLDGKGLDIFPDLEDGFDLGIKGNIWHEPEDTGE